MNFIAYLAEGKRKIKYNIWVLSLRLPPHLTHPFRAFSTAQTFQGASTSDSVPWPHSLQPLLMDKCSRAVSTAVWLLGFSHQTSREGARWLLHHRIPGLPRVLRCWNGNGGIGRGVVATTSPGSDEFWWLEIFPLAFFPCAPWLCLPSSDDANWRTHSQPWHLRDWNDLNGGHVSGSVAQSASL